MVFNFFFFFVINAYFCLKVYLLILEAIITFKNSFSKFLIEELVKKCKSSICKNDVDLREHAHFSEDKEKTMIRKENGENISNDNFFFSFLLNPFSNRVFNVLLAYSNDVSKLILCKLIKDSFKNISKTLLTRFKNMMSKIFGIFSRSEIHSSLYISPKREYEKIENVISHLFDNSIQSEEDLCICTFVVSVLSHCSYLEQNDIFHHIVSSSRSSFEDFSSSGDVMKNDQRPPLISSPPPFFSNRNSSQNFLKKTLSSSTENQQISSLNLSTYNVSNINTNQLCFQSHYLEYLKKNISLHSEKEIISILDSLLRLNQFFFLLVYNCFLVLDIFANMLLEVRYLFFCSITYFLKQMSILIMEVIVVQKEFTLQLLCLNLFP
jgi:hypothetical protein